MLRVRKELVTTAPEGEGVEGNFLNLHSGFLLALQDFFANALIEGCTVGVAVCERLQA